MESYEKLLDKAYSQVKVIGGKGERFEIPRVEGNVSGTNTIITNFAAIANYLRRPLDQIAKFLQKELAVFVKVENTRLVIKSKLNSAKVNEKIEKYSKEFVVCPVCAKPDTEIIADKGIKFKHCLACGAKSPIKYHL